MKDDAFWTACRELELEHLRRERASWLALYHEQGPDATEHYRASIYDRVLRIDDEIARIEEQ